MNNPANPLDGLLAAKRKDVADAEQALAKLKIELATLEQAHAAAEPRGRRAARTKGRKGRPLSENWKRVLRAISSAKESGAKLDDIEKMCAAEGIKINRATMRGQLANYVNRGLVERVHEGFFRLTIEGARAAGMESWSGVENAPLTGGAS